MTSGRKRVAILDAASVANNRVVKTIARSSAHRQRRKRRCHAPRRLEISTTATTKEGNMAAKNKPAHTPIIQPTEVAVPTPESKEQLSDQLVSAIKEKLIILAPQGGPIVVKNQEQANLCGSIVTDIGPVKKMIHDYWDKDVATAHTLHASLSAKRKVRLDQLDKIEAALKLSARLWFEEENRKRITETARLQKIADKKNPEAPPVFMEQPKVPGLTMVKRKQFRLTTDGDPSSGLMLLAIAVVKGKAPMSCLAVNDEYIQKRTESDFGMAVKDDKGRLILFPGVEVYEELGASRSR